LSKLEISNFQSLVTPRNEESKGQKGDEQSIVQMPSRISAGQAVPRHDKTRGFQALTFMICLTSVLQTPEINRY